MPAPDRSADSRRQVFVRNAAYDAEMGYHPTGVPTVAALTKDLEKTGGVPVRGADIMFGRLQARIDKHNK